MRLYTRTGDDGTTGLFGGERVPKDHPRVEAYGTVDEVNAALGLAAAALAEEIRASGKPRLTSGPEALDKHEEHPTASKTRASTEANPAHNLFNHILTTLQSRLFDIGADLATPRDTKHESKIHRIDHTHIKEIENWIDQVEAGNTPMTQFILPGGTELAARLHLARTVSRRAERLMVSLLREATISSATLIYMNRVSDLLFAMARRANTEAGVADVPWVKG